MQGTKRKKKFIRNKYNTRINCICEVRTAYMIYEGITIGSISEERNDAGEFDWVIRVFWDNWLKAGHVQIAGIDMDLRLDEYVRSYIPAFVEERTLPDTRESLYEELAEVGLTYNDRFEYMCRTGGLCGCNDITISRERI